MEISVGSIVRVTRRRNDDVPRTDSAAAGMGGGTTTKPMSGRAMIATTSDGGGTAGTCSILWEDHGPKPLPDAPRFLVAPTIRRGRSSSEKESPKGDLGREEEDDVPLTCVSALLPFELECAEFNKSHGAMTYKSQGDELLRLRDPTSAIARYEAALAQTHSPSVGGTGIINVDGYPTLAEIDCVNDEDGTLDVTYVSSKDDMSEKERTVRENDILLALLDNDEDGVQERILLNLSRCLQMLAEFDDTTGGGAPGTDNRRHRYLKSAVLSCSLVLSSSDHRGKDDNAGKARYLRARAYLDMNKFKHAESDLRHILTSSPEDAAANRLLQDLRRRSERRKKIDKKLAREMCGLVQKATRGKEDALG